MFQFLWFGKYDGVWFQIVKCENSSVITKRFTFPSRTTCVQTITGFLQYFLAWQMLCFTVEFWGDDTLYVSLANDTFNLYPAFFF